jgi:hypothetical protein
MTPGKYFVWAYLNQTSQYINLPIGTNCNGSISDCPQGQWHHVRTTWRLDNSPNGFCYSWFNGVQVLSYTGQFAHSACANFYQHLDVYRGTYSGTATAGPAAVWYANFEFTTGSQPYSSRISNPLPVPPLT